MHDAQRSTTFPTLRRKFRNRNVQEISARMLVSIPRFVTSSGGGTPAYGLSPFIGGRAAGRLDGQMGWMVDLEGISDSKYVIDTASEGRPSFRHLCIHQQTKQVNLVFGQSDMMRLMDTCTTRRSPSNGNIIHDSIFRTAVSTPAFVSPRRSSIRIVKFEHSVVTMLGARVCARSAEEPNTQEWKITYTGAHDAVNEVSPYDTFAYLARAARLQVAALPNRNYEEWRITYAYVRTKIMIGRVDVCGAEDAWGNQYMEEFERVTTEKA
ncbi:hypothetical protein EDD17DRAFT_1509347 [Pisolithus thermaeus]|nr:hypothetical protein EV401DRAFT_1894020 [Pisolithus croceorrhizus]KAI6161390.1 hypothetical protein EDD17DRAFT_1509347 [Pisolithus thermaeus]